MKKIRVSLFFISIFLVFSFSNLFGLNLVGEIERVDRKAWFFRENVWERANDNDKLYKKDVIKTGKTDRASLTFLDGSRFFLGNSTIFSIDEYILSSNLTRTKISLLCGKLRCFVSQLKRKTVFLLSTKTATVGVKGTDFIVYKKGFANVIFGERGEVVVSSGGKSIFLRESFMTENTKDVSPIKPVSIKEDKTLLYVRSMLLNTTTCGVPISWVESGKLNQILARWNINYGHYLVDKKRFKEAIDVFRIAFDLSKDNDIRAESLMQRANVFLRFLNDRENAKFLLEKIVKEYPKTPQSEVALYSLGMIFYEEGKAKKALFYLRGYKKLYPSGRYNFSVDLLIKRIKEKR